MDGKDCIGAAKTGSGKTLAFALPILQKLSEDPYGIYALVLTPTRELAFQIAEQFRVVGKPINLRDCVVVGGRDMVLQGQELANRPHIVIATPGRLADHLVSCDTFTLKKIKYLVLDEADRLLDGSFQGQLKTIFDALPPIKRRQTLMFSATITDSVRETMKEVMQSEDPFMYSAKDVDEEFVSSEMLKQHYLLTPFEARDAYLVQVVRKFTEQNSNSLIIVFTKTCKSCQLISMTLNQLGFPSAALHSMRPQKERTAALSQFRSAQVKILVATDVASRGLDIPQVQLVVNHNVPSVTKDYVHRIGRTARAGRQGRAVTLVTPSDVVLVKAVEDLIGTKLTEYDGINDADVAEIHVQVSVTKREQDIKLSEMDFDEKRNINRRKKLIEQGQNPDQVEMEKRKAWKAKQRELRKQRKKLKTTK